MKAVIFVMLSAPAAFGAAIGFYSPAPPLQTGLIAYWPLNEGTGTNLYDQSWNSNHIKLIMPGVYSLSSSNTLITQPMAPGWTNDGTGMAMGCNGTLYGVPDKPGIFAALSNYFSICFWFRTTNSALQNWFTSSHWNTGSGLSLGLGYGGKYRLELGLTAGGVSPDSFTNYPGTNSGSWICYCSTWSNNVSTVYTNGVLAYAVSHDDTVMTNHVQHRFFTETTNSLKASFPIGSYTNCFAANVFTNVSGTNRGIAYTNPPGYRYRRTRSTTPQWVGSIKRLYLYDRVLTPGDVALLYTQ